MTYKKWHIGVRQPSSDKFIYGENGEEVADCDMLTNFADQNLANARLIAAAPALLDALQTAQMAMLGYTPRNDIINNALDKALAAISMATGGAK